MVYIRGDSYKIDVEKDEFDVLAKALDVLLYRGELLTPKS